uniref:Uncharacterized protein n=1 Tax=Anguilla anguilla TaxID=7936 RepID=A0A0E9SSJ0_ANGAN
MGMTVHWASDRNRLISEKLLKSGRCLVHNPGTLKTV